MADKPISPFSGLDRALLRSTKAKKVDARPPDSPPPSSSPDSASAIQQASRPASSLASATSEVNLPDPGLIERIRKTVKAPGKEVSFVRLTPAEKQELADVVYTYKRQGKKTTENEIARIALNYLLADYHASGELSVLAQVIDALLA